VFIALQYQSKKGAYEMTKSPTKLAIRQTMWISFRSKKILIKIITCSLIEDYE